MKKGILVLVVMLFSMTLSYASFTGNYKGSYKSKQITAKIKERGNSIKGTVTYGTKKYTLNAKKSPDSISEAKGQVTKGSEKRRVHLEKIHSNIKITLYPRSMKDKMISAKLLRVKSKVSTNKFKAKMKEKAKKRVAKNSNNFIIGRWINDNGELEMRSDGSYNYLKVIIDEPKFKKRTFDTTNKNKNDTSGGLRVTTGNANIQIGSSNMGGSIETDNKGDTTGKKSWRDRNKKNYHLTTKQKLDTEFSSFGYWKVKNKSLYITQNGSSTQTFFGQVYKSSKSMIIVKNDGTQLIFYKVK